MKKAALFFKLIIAATIGIISCKKESVNKATYTIKVNECTPAAGENFIVCFDSLITDSRCPIDAICVWEGFALAKFSLHQNGNVIPFSLATRAFHQYHQYTTINQIKISLQNILYETNVKLPSVVTTSAVLKIN